MTTIRISATVPRAIPLNWFQDDGVTPLDCSTFTCEVLRTAMRAALTIEPVNRAAGQFQFAALPESQLARLRVGAGYSTHVVLRNSAGDPVDEFRCVFEAV